MNNEETKNVFQIFFETIVERQDAVLTGLQEHLVLSFIAIFIAILISVPLGILISRMKKLAEFFIGITAIFQTIPSLALFGFLIPVFGIGSTTAIISLTLYALLPILRNTYTGIMSVEQSAIEAGKGMGMTDFQILKMIQLPLSIPVIMAGIRTATVLTIGVATLATFVGAGGLGDLIYRGLSTWNNYLVLAGAIPSALLAIAFDFLLRFLERVSTPKGLQKT